MTIPRVSIIVPIYGVEQFVVRCVQSLFSQTLDNIEFIFIDDCTPDDSMFLLEKEINKNRTRIAAKNWIVRTEKMSSNSGIAAVRRYGIQLATGEYIIHCDSDDWVTGDYCEELYTRAVAENADLVICDYYMDDGAGKNVEKKAMRCSVSEKDLFRQALLQTVGASVWNKLVKRDIVKKEGIVHARANMGEDYVMTIQYMYYSKHISYVEKPLYCYFFNENSITKSVSEEKIYYRFRQSIENMGAIMQFMEREGLEKMYTNELDKMRLAKKNNLLPIISKKKYYDLWLNTFPEIKYRILGNNCLTIAEKVKYALILTRIIRH